jgi:hypothetical protein
MKYFLAIPMILAFSFSPTLAQYNPGSTLILFNVGWTLASPEGIDADLDGNTFSFSYEKTAFDGAWSAGFAINYSTMSADSLNSGGNKVDRVNKVSYQVIPVSVFGKLMLGSDKLRGYVGAGFGVQFSNIHYFTQIGQITGYESGFLFSGLAGGYFFLSKSVLLNANYSINYLENSFFRDGIAHNINIGIGFQFN